MSPMGARREPFAMVWLVRSLFGVLDVASLVVSGTLLGFLVACLRSRPGTSGGRV
jgi:hypothetical protein